MIEIHTETEPRDRNYIYMNGVNVMDKNTPRISLCLLGAINLTDVVELTELEYTAEMIVRSLDAIIDLQEYPIPAAGLATKKSRYLGVGWTGLATYLAKRGVKYQDPKAVELVHDLAEHHVYYLIKASIQLAKEQGACEWFDRTKYSKGILPIDHYKEDVDQLHPPILKLDWEELRSDLLKYGMRNSALAAIMPVQSSSVVSNTTNGIEPPRQLINTIVSKKRYIKQIIPYFDLFGNDYTLLYDAPITKSYINLCAVIQKFFDQSISANTSYSPKWYTDNEIPLSEVIYDVLYAYKMGLKTLYYDNTDDMRDDQEEDENKNSCDGVCTL